VCNVLVSGVAIRKEHGEKNIVDIIDEEDERINDYAQKLRTRIMEYLAANSAPDVPSALILTSIIIDLERLGDYTKDLARLTLFKPVEMKGKYFTAICNIKNKILKVFELTSSAFENKNKDEAIEAMDMHDQVKKLTDELLIKLEKDEALEGHYGVVYALYLRFFRRVSAHLQNIASSVVAPFPYLGFKKGIEFIKKTGEAEKVKEEKAKEKREKKQNSA
ncbi:MAG: PhoU domain-containing protein, partial [archaeon]